MNVTKDFTSKESEAADKIELLEGKLSSFVDDNKNLSHKLNQKENFIQQLEEKLGSYEMENITLQSQIKNLECEKDQL